MEQQLTCSECGATFERPGARGPVPTRCASCRTARKRERHAKEERARQQRRRLGQYRCGRCGKNKPGADFAPSQRRDGHWCRRCFAETYVERSGGWITKNCKVCGEEFRVTRRGARKVYCSRRCKDRAAQERDSARKREAKRDRICENCGVAVPLERFATARYCTEECRRQHVGPTIRRRSALKAQYGMTLEDFDAMLERQGGGCAICGTTEIRGFGKHLAVDHCHDTGAVRGLLCGGCNRGIGALGHDPDRLRAAIKYLTTT